MQNPQLTPEFSLLQPTEKASLSNSREQNCKERPNRFKNNGYIAEKAKRLRVSETVTFI